MNKEISEAPLLGSWKNQSRIRIEFLGRKHRGQRIKIGIGMSGDDVHTLRRRLKGTFLLAQVPSAASSVVGCQLLQRTRTTSHGKLWIHAQSSVSRSLESPLRTKLYALG